MNRGEGGGGEITKGHKETNGNDGYVHCSGSVTGIHKCQNLHTLNLCSFCMSIIVQ